MWSTLDYRQEGHIAHSDASSLQVAAYSDAYFAGGLDTHHSTTGGHLCIEGQPLRFPLHSSSKQQDSTASATPEADIVAAGTVSRHVLVLSLGLWGLVLPNGVQELPGCSEGRQRCVREGDTIRP